MKKCQSFYEIIPSKRKAICNFRTRKEFFVCEGRLMPTVETNNGGMPSRLYLEQTGIFWAFISASRSQSNKNHH